MFIKKEVLNAVLIALMGFATPLAHAGNVSLNHSFKNKLYDVKCFSDNGVVIVSYDSVSALSFKEAIMTFNDKDGNPHVLTSQGICDYVQHKQEIAK